MILDSKNIKYEVIDITEPGKEADKEFMQQNSNAKDAKHPLPPQIFSDETYCGVSCNTWDHSTHRFTSVVFLDVHVSSLNYESHDRSLPYRNCDAARYFSRGQALNLMSSFGYSKRPSRAPSLEMFWIHLRFEWIGHNCNITAINRVIMLLKITLIIKQLTKIIFQIQTSVLF